MRAALKRAEGSFLSPFLTPFQADVQGVMFQLTRTGLHSNSNVATVLVLRGQLKVGAQVVAGLTRCKVRQMTPPTGKAIKVALPGQPVEITGWRDLPQAGDEVLEANSDDEAKRAMEARQRRHEQLEMFSDVEAINEKRRIEAEQEAVQRAAQEAQEKAGKNILLGERAPKPAASEPEFKELPLIIRADVSGTAEAVAGVLEGIGNNEARVKIVSSEVGDVTESDLTLAKSAGGACYRCQIEATFVFAMVTDDQDCHVSSHDCRLQRPVSPLHPNTGSIQRHFCAAGDRHLPLGGHGDAASDLVAARDGAITDRGRSQRASSVQHHRQRSPDQAYCGLQNRQRHRITSF